MSNMKVALVYDRVNKWGGAERVLLALHELFPDAPLYTSVYSPGSASWAKVFDVRTSFLQNVPYAAKHHEFLPLFMPFAFESFSLDEYDLVISVTSEAAKGIITKPHTKHICYCLTPTRYLWSGYDEYFKNDLSKIISAAVISYLRKWDKAAANRPDLLIGISKEVQQRIKRYYERDSKVIYPPVTINKTVIARSEESNDEARYQTVLGEAIPTGLPRFARNDKKREKGDYFLVVSRLSKFTRYKRIDLAIQACNELQLPLKIIGSGNWKKDLQTIAGHTIEFLGNVTDDELVTYYQHCKALIFPGIEDFGLTIIEAQKYGKPVIAFRGGGAVETIREGKTGCFFNKQTTESLVEIMKKFDSFTFDEKECMKQAERYSFKNFKTSFLSLLDSIL